MRHLFILSALLLTACQSNTVQGWKGRWNGPEGTFLHVDPGVEECYVRIQNLDSSQTYLCSLREDALVFMRNGELEALRPGTGEDTGVKWLASENNCLIVRWGEGFCR